MVLCAAVPSEPQRIICSIRVDQRTFGVSYRSGEVRAMSIRPFDATTHVRQEPARMRTGAIGLVWGTCLVACLLFWFFILTALLG